jgi:Flp pilus assembly protein TadD
MKLAQLASSLLAAALLVTPVAASHAQALLPIKAAPDKLDSILVSAEKSEDFYLNRGMNRVQQGDYQGAIEDFTEAIRLNPNNAEVYKMRGIVRLVLGEGQAAITDLTQVIRLHPNDAEAYKMRGIVHLTLTEGQAAIADLTEAIRLDPKRLFVKRSLRSLCALN